MGWRRPAWPVGDGSRDGSRAQGVVVYASVHQCEKVVTIKFDPNGKGSIQNVKSISARELADRAKAKELVQSGETKSKAGDRGGATAEYARAIKLDPKNSDAYNNRGSEKQDAGDLDGAMADYNHAIEANPNASIPYYNRGAIYFLRRDWNKAIPDLQHHDELNEEDEEAPALIWIARVRLGEKEAADRELAKFISDHPDFAESWNTSATALEAVKEYAIAEFTIRRRSNA